MKQLFQYSAIENKFSISPLSMENYIVENDVILLNFIVLKEKLPRISNMNYLLSLFITSKIELCHKDNDFIDSV